jgi:hypothetical protein
MAARRAVRDAKKAADREAEAAAQRAVDEHSASVVRRGGTTARRIPTGTWRRARLMLTGMRASLAPAMEDFELPKAAILDLDGTPLDSVDLHAIAWQEVMLEFGHDVSFEQARSQIGRGEFRLPARRKSQQIVAGEFVCRCFGDRWFSRWKKDNAGQFRT